jgi:hypothetical protein
MTFQPGQSGNPNGRPVGVFRQADDLKRRIAKLPNGKDPFDFCSEVVANPNESTELRLQAANYQLPYLYNKRGTVTPARYIEQAVTLPSATSIEQANENISRISEMKALGQIDLDFADSLIADNRTANNLIAADELRLKLANSPLASKEQTIKVDGGLPSLPGCNVTMPELNGHNGHVIEGIPAPVPAPQTPATTDQKDGP